MQKRIQAHNSGTPRAPENEFNCAALTRREFAALTAAGVSAATLATNPLYAAARNLAAPAAAETKVPLDLAEWSYFWVGVERADLARGAVVNGKQMYVEYMIPSQVKHPYPIVLVHGGGGQGTDWMGNPRWPSRLVGIPRSGRICRLRCRSPRTRSAAISSGTARAFSCSSSHT